MVVDKAPRGLSSRNPTTRWIEDARVMQMQGNQLRQVSLQQTESPMSGLEHSGEQGWRALAAGTHSSLSLSLINRQPLLSQQCWLQRC